MAKTLLPNCHSNPTGLLLESNIELVRRIATYNSLPTHLKNGIPSLVYVGAGFELSRDGQPYCDFCKSQYKDSNSGGNTKKDILKEHLINSPLCQMAQKCWKKISNITETDKQWYKQNVLVVAELTNRLPQKTCKDTDNTCNNIEKTANPDKTDEQLKRLKNSFDERLRTFHKWSSTHPITATDLAENGFYYRGIGDHTTCAHCEGTLCDWDPKDIVAQEHIKHFPNCSFALSCLDSSKKESKISKNFDLGIEFDSFQQNLKNDEGQTKLGQIEELVSRTSLEEQQKTKLDAKCLKEEIWIMKERKLCKICLSKDVDTVFLPCGHLVCCRDCAAKIKHCAICRQLIRGTVLAFIPDDVRENNKVKSQRGCFENMTESHPKLLKPIIL